MLTSILKRKKIINLCVLKAVKCLNYPFMVKSANAIQQAQIRGESFSVFVF